MPADRTVLHVVNSLEGGGTERALLQILCGLAAEEQPEAAPPRVTCPFGGPRSTGRCRHVLVTLRTAGDLAARLSDAVACHALELAGRSWSAGLELAQIVRHRRAVLIHARGLCCWPDALIAKSLNPRSKLVLGFHGATETTRLGRKARWLAKLGVAAGARFATVAESGVRRLSQELGIPQERIDLLPNGVCVQDCVLARSAREDRRRAFGFNPDNFVIGMVGTLAPIKRHDLLMGAMALLKDPRARTLIVGAGPLRADLERMAAARNLSHAVRFAGRREDVPALLSAMDAFVCCSDAECMSNAVLEAMAAGKPVIATDVGDNNRILRGGTGMVVPPGSAQRLAEAVRLVMDDPDTARRLGKAASLKAQEFDMARTLGLYRDYYNLHTFGPGPGAATHPHSEARTPPSSVVSCADQAAVATDQTDLVAACSSGAFRRHD